MNLDIKFRGKRLDNGEWVYGDLNHDADGTTCVNNRPVDPATVGQLLGSLGNGEQVFYGDLIETNNIDGRLLWLIECEQDTNGSLVSFEFRTTDNRYSAVHNQVFETGKVIGNIHDDPELLNNNEKV